MPAPSPSFKPGLLLSFDFDGTLHDPASDPPVPGEFFQRLAWLDEVHGIAWGINTGRSLEHLEEGMRDSDFAFSPDWVVTREREIHMRDEDGFWHPHFEWNENCDREIEELFSSHQLLLDRIRREVGEQTGAQWLSMEGEPAGVIAQTEEEIEWIVSRVVEYLDPDSDLSWQRNSIYLRFGHKRYQKGSSMAEIARWFGLGPGQCFAIGDSHNDVEMLDAVHAGMAACPANAIELIKQQVRARGGLVTKAAHGEGVMEALDHYFDMSRP